MARKITYNRDVDTVVGDRPTCVGCGMGLRHASNVFEIRGPFDAPPTLRQLRDAIAGARSPAVELALKYVLDHGYRPERVFRVTRFDGDDPPWYRVRHWTGTFDGYFVDPETGRKLFHSLRCAAAFGFRAYKAGYHRGA